MLPFKDRDAGLAFRIATDTPVSAYDIIPYGGWASRIPGAALLLPTAAWGSNYIAFAPSGVSPPQNEGELWATVVAREDGTTVKVAPPVSLIGGANLLPAPAGEVTEYTLAAGEAIQWIDPQWSGRPIRPAPFSRVTSRLVFGPATPT